MLESGPFSRIALMVRDGDTVETLSARILEHEDGRLILVEPDRGTSFINFAPRAPEREVSGKIVSVYRGITQVGITRNVPAIDELCRAIEASERATAECEGMRLRLAVDYSSRDSIVRAAFSASSTV